MIKKIVAIVASALCIAGSVKGQNTCITDEVYQKLKSEHPEIAVYEEQLEREIAAKMRTGDFEKLKLAKTTGYDANTVYDIPVVIHIIHDYGVEDIADNTIVDAVTYWSEVYQLHNTDTSGVIAPFKKYIGDPRIKIHLATIDPNGNPTKGIVRHQSYLTFNGGDQAKLDDWPQDKYVNLWFVNKFGGANLGAAAYAYYPSAGATMPYYDGVIGLYNYINYDKAIPHEIGHVLNLEHPWGNTNAPDVACGDDMVDDTPPTKGHNPVGCVPAALYDTTCATGYTKLYTSIDGTMDSLVDYPDTTNAQNIMDYTYCQLMFTNLQTVRMRIALTSNTASRNNLYSPQNLTATGALAAYPDLPPIADFDVEKGLGGTPLANERSFFLCINDATQFHFVNHSWNDTISGVSWSFSNGPSMATSSSLANVYNTFSQPGWATVTLTANSNAGSNTISRRAVYVADTASYNPYGYEQDFTDTNAFSNWPMFNFYDNQFKWEWYNGAGVNDQACIRFRSFDDRTSPENKSGTPVGDHDDIYTPAFNLSSFTSGDLNLNFYTAGARKNENFGTGDDSMQIFVSTTCGGRWVRIGVLQSSDIYNNTAQNTEFVPTNPSQWVAHNISVPAEDRTDRTFFRFRYWSGDRGNDMYFDDFRVSPWTTEVNEVMNKTSEFSVYPNPAKSEFNIAYMSGVNGRVSYDIKDITGKTVYHVEESDAPNTLVQRTIQRSQVPNAGIYFITLMVDNSKMTQKLVLY